VGTATDASAEVSHAMESGGATVDATSADSPGTGADGEGGNPPERADGAGPDAVAEAGPPPVDPCIEAGTCAPGAWVNVTPSAVSLDGSLSCGNFGTLSVVVDPMHPESAYAEFNCQGIWKSSDYGLTWTGPVNVGQNGTTVGDCAGGISVASNAPGPILYQSCIRGAGIGFWKSTNGGVDWTNYVVGPGGQRQDFYPPSVDPYDGGHLLMPGHEMNLLVQSTDGGQTWTAISVDPRMSQNGGTAAIAFIDTGDRTTTARTWLYLAQGAAGQIGTWRTTDGGATWAQVDTNEKGHSYYQIYQPDTAGTVFMAGVYSAEGWGVLKSADYGQTWAHVGATINENIAFGTKKHVYAMNGWAVGAGGTVDPALQVADPSGTTWTSPGTPSAMTQGPAGATVTSDGTYNIVLAACYNAGLWRYVEP
jgi:photosystem II stability/assembly factor-like uncharacterized protein